MDSGMRVGEASARIAVNQVSDWDRKLRGYCTQWCDTATLRHPVWDQCVSWPLQYRNSVSKLELTYTNMHGRNFVGRRSFLHLSPRSQCKHPHETHVATRVEKAGIH